MTRLSTSIAALLGGVGLATLVACGSKPPSAEPRVIPAARATVPQPASAPPPKPLPSPHASGRGIAPTATTSPVSSTTPTSTPTPTPTPRATPTPTITITPIGSADGCLHGALLVSDPWTEDLQRTSCAHVGAEFAITLTAHSGYRWTPISSSDHAVIAVADGHTAADGNSVTVLRALHSGTAVLRSSDLYLPDPGGPPSHLWQLTVRVSP